MEMLPLIKELCREYNAHVFLVLFLSLMAYCATLIWVVKAVARMEKNQELNEYKFGYVGEKLTEIKDILGVHTGKIETIEKTVDKHGSDLIDLKHKFERIHHGRKEKEVTSEEEANA